MKHFIFIVLLGLLLLPVMSDCKAASEDSAVSDTVLIYFFHNTACGSCDGTKEFLDTAAEQISQYKDEYPYELYLYNVFKSGERDTMEAVFKQYGLDTENLQFPVMLIDGSLYEGMDSINYNIRDAYLNAAKNYFTELKQK